MLEIQEEGTDVEGEMAEQAWQKYYTVQLKPKLGPALLSSRTPTNRARPIIT